MSITTSVGGVVKTFSSWKAGVGGVSKTLEVKTGIGGVIKTLLSTANPPEYAWTPEQAFYCDSENSVTAWSDYHTYVGGTYRVTMSITISTCTGQLDIYPNMPNGNTGWYTFYAPGVLLRTLADQYDITISAGSKRAAITFEFTGVGSATGVIHELTFTKIA